MSRTMRTLALSLVFLALAGFVRADETDPEPPGGSTTLRQLQGTWQSVRRILGGRESEYPAVVYTFAGDKATYTLNGKAREGLKVEADKKRRHAFSVTLQGAKVPTKYHFKIEKGELYLVIDRSKDSDAKPDFTGTSMPVIVYQKTQK